MTLEVVFSNRGQSSAGNARQEGLAIFLGLQQALCQKSLSAWLRDVIWLGLAAALSQSLALDK